MADAGILQVIQDGYNGTFSAGPNMSTHDKAAQAWSEFFKTSTKDRRAQIAAWGKAEQLGVEYGMGLATNDKFRAGDTEQSLTNAFVFFGNWYRSSALTPNIPMLGTVPTFPSMTRPNLLVVPDPSSQYDLVDVREWARYFEKGVTAPKLSAFLLGYQ